MGVTLISIIIILAAVIVFIVEVYEYLKILGGYSMDETLDDIKFGEEIKEAFERRDKDTDFSITITHIEDPKFEVIIVPLGDLCKVEHKGYNPFTFCGKEYSKELCSKKCMFADDKLKWCGYTFDILTIEEVIERLLVWRKNNKYKVSINTRRGYGLPQRESQKL